VDTHASSNHQKTLSSSVKEKITGADLVEGVLQNGGTITDLMELAEKSESDWLEFKAALELRKGEDPKGDKPGDLKLHVAKAVIAMFNTHGGAVLLGINDDGDAVGLEHSDPRGIFKKEGKDAFIRMIIDPAIQPSAEKGWKTKGGKYFADKPIPSNCLTTTINSYQEKEVVMLLIRPLKEEFLFIHNKNTETEKLYIRELGEKGKIKGLYKNSEIEAHKKSRRMTSPRYARILEDFRNSKDGQLPMEQGIKQYYQQMGKKLSELDQFFTHLSGEEEITQPSQPSFSPQAEKCLFDTDDLWDEDDEPYEDNNSYKTDNMVETPRKGDIFTLLQNEPRAILQGEPGGGKTTTLTWLICEANKAYQTGGLVALLLPLKKYSHKGLNALLEQQSKLNIKHLKHLASHGRLK
jgi:hypothetical protein